MPADLPADDAPMLVVGLGNPGPRYVANRHNIGFLVADELADRVGGRFKSHKAGADVLEGRLGGRRVALAKPRAYMNLSGGPVVGHRAVLQGGAGARDRPARRAGSAVRRAFGSNWAAARTGTTG